MKKKSTSYKLIIFVFSIVAFSMVSFSLHASIQTIPDLPVDQGAIKSTHQIIDDGKGTIHKNGKGEGLDNTKSVFDPQIIGLDEELYLNESHYNRNVGEWFPLYFNPSFLFTDSIAWHTSGEGYFEDPDTPTTYYHFAGNDKWTKKLILTVEAFNFTGGGSSVSESIEVYVPFQIINLKTELGYGNSYWMGLSSYLDKSTSTVPEVVEPLVGSGPGSENLEMLVNEGGQYYWPVPSPPINNLGNWEAIGYKAKLNNPDYLLIYGDMLTDQTFNVSGPNVYLPVLTNHEVAVEELFTDHLDEILMIYDWGSSKVWTQAASTLNYLSPGKSYGLINKSFSTNFTITYPEIDLDAPLLEAPDNYPVNDTLDKYPPIWNEIITSSEMCFNIIKLAANPRINDIPLSPGDYIGVFYEDDDGEMRCAGAEYWTGDSPIIVVAFGNASYTPEKDGFSYGETMVYKLFSYATMKEYSVDVFEFDPEQPNTEQWYNNGFSAVTNMQAQVDLEFYISGSDNTICSGTQINLFAEELIGSQPPYSFEWTSDPPGFLSSLQDPPPFIPLETTTFFLTVSDGILTSEHALTIQLVGENPIVDPGDDITVCADVETVQLNATVENHQYAYWTTSGDGFVDDNTNLNTFYYPGVDDRAFGSVNLCLHAYPINPLCAQVVEECMTIYFAPSPEAYAGSNDTICEGQDFNLSEAEASNYSSINWITNGDGTFDNHTSLNPVYSPGPGDIAFGAVGLCMEAQTDNGCNTSDVSCMILTIIEQPTIDLPEHDSLNCEHYNFNENDWMPIPLYFDANNISLVQWSTGGDGYFDDPTAQYTYYYLGELDIANAEVELTIQANSPCDMVVQDSIILYIPRQLISFENSLRRGISSYLDLSSYSLPEIVGPIVDCFDTITNQYGQYYVPGGVNQLGNWGPSGYLLDMNCVACLPLFGEPLENKTFQVTDSVVFLPVLSDVTIEIETIFAGHLDRIKHIYDWETGEIFIPGTVTVLTHLDPGKAYLLNSIADELPYTISFSEVLAPVLSVEIDSVNKVLVQGESMQGLFNISNLGLEDLAFSLELEIDAGKSNEWISIEPASGNVPAGGVQEVILNFNATGMTYGSHTATIIITSNDLTSPVLEIPVTMNVTNSRTILFEPFEDYNAGSQLAEQAINLGYDYWTTWSNNPGSNEDPLVRDEIVFEGNNAVKIEGQNDVVLLLDDYTEGKYNIDFYVNIPTERYGYFNLLQDFNGQNSEWGMQVYFNSEGNGQIDAGGTAAALFTYSYDTWHHFFIVVDLDQDYAEMFFDETSLVEWQWSSGAQGSSSLNQLSAMNLFAYDNLGTPEAYFDNISVKRVVSHSIVTDSLALVDLYNSTDGPNWTNDTNWLTGPLSTWHGITIEEGRVTSVEINDNQLSGSIPESLGGPK